MLKTCPADMPVYPTKEEILAALYQPTEAEYTRVREWKKTFYNKKWKDLTTEQKMSSLMMLAAALCEANNLKSGDWPKLLVSDIQWSYDSIDRTIYMDERIPSIVSTLHEFGHFLHFSGYLLGRPEETELVACRYSVGIYKQCFPKSYNKLVWQNHMLMAPKDAVIKA